MSEQIKKRDQGAEGPLLPSKRKGKKSRPWRGDVDILRRLDVVATMMVQGAQSWQIAEALEVSLKTITRDRRRVRLLWKDKANDEVEECRQESLAQLRSVRMHAWDRYTAKDSDGKVKNSATWLRIILEAERDIAKLEGTQAPVGVDLTSMGERVLGPIIFMPAVDGSDGNDGP